MISSLIAPVNAKFKAVLSSSNLGHNTPGVSNISISKEVFIHCLLFVTPALSPVLAILFLAILFINVDLPQFGMPTTITLIINLTKPLALALSCFSFNKSKSAGFICCRPCPLKQLTSKTLTFSLDNSFTHALVTLDSDKSLLFNKITLGFPAQILSMSGFAELLGILASLISITASTSFKFSTISLFVFFICPGNQLIVAIIQTSKSIFSL